MVLALDFALAKLWHRQTPLGAFLSYPLYPFPERGCRIVGDFCVRCGSRVVSRVLEGKPRRICQACKAVSYRDVIAAVSAIVYDRHDRLVLVRRAIEPGFGRWVIPGGYVEAGETMEAAAVRETREEIDIPLGEPVLSGVYSSPETPVVTIVYAIPGQFEEPDAGIETLQAKAFPIDAIPWSEVYFAATRQAMRDWIKKAWPTKNALATSRGLE